MKKLSTFCTPYDVFGGLLSGLLIIVLATAFTALVFKGSLLVFFSIGINCALVGSLITNFLTASFGSLRFGVARIETTTAVILAIMFANIATQLSTLTGFALLPTLLAALSVTSLMTGLILFLLGFFRLGHIIRFLPYPVMGGLISGTAWIIGYSSFAILINNNFTLHNLLQHEIMLQYASGLGFAVLVFGLTKKNQRAWILPALILLFTVVLNLFLFINHISHAEAVTRGWFFPAFKPTFVLQTLDFSMLGQINWLIIFHQFGYLLSLAGIIVIIILFTVSSLETTFSVKADLDHELKIAGVGNLISSAFIGAPANLSFTGTIVNKNIGSSNRSSGIIATLVCIVALFIYPEIVSYLPKPMIAGLLISVTLSLLVKWLYTDRHKLPLLDYLIMLSILISIAIYGFMPGVIAGIIITSVVFIIRYARIDTIKYFTTRQNYPSNVVRPIYEQEWLNLKGKSIYLFKLQNYIFFGSAKFLLDTVINLLNEDSINEIRFLIFDFQHVNGMDSSASYSFIRLQQLIKHLNIQIIFTHCSKELLEQFKNQDVIGKSSNIIILHDLDQGMEWCENQLLNTMPTPFKHKEETRITALSQLMLSEEKQQIFKNYLERIEIPANCYLCKEGDKVDCLYFIEQGDISVLLERQHDTIRLSKSGPGTIVGEIGFYLHIPRSASVRTETPCIIYQLTEKSIKELEESYPDIAMSFHKSIIHVLALHVIQTNYELKLVSQ